MTWGGSSLSVPAAWLRALVVPLVILAWLAVLVVAGWLMGHVAHTLLMLILSGYLAANGANIAHWLRTETPHGTTRYRAQLLVAVVTRVVGGYIRGVLLLAVLIGVLVWLGLAVLGVPYAVLLGVLAF